MFCQLGTLSLVQRIRFTESKPFFFLMKKDNHLVQESDLDTTWKLLDFLGFLINTLNVL